MTPAPLTGQSQEVPKRKRPGLAEQFLAIRDRIIAAPPKPGENKQHEVAVYETAAFVADGHWTLAERDDWLAHLDVQGPFSVRDSLLGEIILQQIKLEKGESFIVSVDPRTGQVLGANEAEMRLRPAGMIRFHGERPFESTRSHRQFQQLVKDFPRQTLLLVSDYHDQLRVERNDRIHPTPELVLVGDSEIVGARPAREFNPIASVATVARPTPQVKSPMGTRSRPERIELHYSSQLGVRALVQRAEAARAKGKFGKAEVAYLAAEVLAGIRDRYERAVRMKTLGLTEDKDVREMLIRSTIENQIDPDVKQRIAVFRNSDCMLLEEYATNGDEFPRQCSGVRRQWIAEGGEPDVTVVAANYITGGFLSVSSAAGNPLRDIRRAMAEDEELILMEMGVEPAYGRNFGPGPAGELTLA